jgi:translation initiation factor 4E
VATVGTVEEFWGVYQHCKRPSALDDNSILYLFKEDIKPVWEDLKNSGAFVLKFEK